MYDPESVSLLLDKTVIEDKLKELAEKIAAVSHGKKLILLGILKGSFMLLADFSRKLWEAGLTDFEVDFMGIASYGKDTESSKNPRITKDADINIRGRNVLIVEDIVDTGYSLDALQRILTERQPESLKTLVLLSKSSRRQASVKLDYVGFEVEGWVEGYGLDTAELFRGRPEVVVRKG